MAALIPSAIDAIEARTDAPDPRLLRMLADRMPQAVGFFCPRRTPTYINPAFARLLGLAGCTQVRAEAPEFQYALSRECGSRETVSTILRRLRERGEWHGEIGVRHPRRRGWSLNMTGRIQLLCEGSRRIGYAVIGMCRQDSRPAPHEPLTPREREVLAALIAGRRSKAIGLHMGISHRTVETHRANIMAKFRVKTLPDLLRLAMRAAPV